jgi:hypothetical protein
MDRRHYLALLAAAGTASTAGCNTDDLAVPGDDTPTPDSTPTDQPTETPEATETESPTETERELSAEEEEAEQRLQEADDYIGDALDTYASTGDAESFLDVRASGGRFDWPPVERAASQAREPISAARNKGNAEQRERAAALSRIRGVIVQAARAQSALGKAYPSFERIHEGYLAERFGDVSGERDAFTSATSEADSRLENALEQFQPADAESCEALSQADYEAKLEQLRAERDAFTGLAGTFEPLIRGMRNFKDGVGSFVSERWTPANDSFTTAADRVSSSGDALSDDDVGDEAFDTLYGELESVVDAIAGASTPLAEAALAYRAGDTATGNDHLDDGKNALGAARSLLRDHDSAEDVFDFDER